MQLAFRQKLCQKEQQATGSGLFGKSMKELEKTWWWIAMPFLSPLSIFATRYGTSTPRAPDCPAVWNWKKTITGISVARLWYYLYTLLMPAIVHSFCSSVNEKSCNLRVCVNPLPDQNTLLCRVAQVGRLPANAKYAFNSFAGRIIANPQQKM